MATLHSLMEEIAMAKNTVPTRPAAELALLAKLNEARKSNDPAKLNEVRDYIVAAKNVVADFNKVVDAFAKVRSADDPMVKVERIQLRESGAGRPSKTEEELFSAIFGE